MSTKSGYQHDVEIVGSGSMIPMDLQSRYHKTIQTHNAVSVSAVGSSSSAWIDVSGYNEVAVTLQNDTTADSNISVCWSHDGSSKHGIDSSIASGNYPLKAINVPVKARYMLVMIVNTDSTSAHTMSSWAYLKV